MKIKVGDMVRVKPNILSPKYKWGAINHSNIGMVKKISPDGVECQVDFVQQTGWTGLVAEMELTASAHPGIRFGLKISYLGTFDTDHTTSRLYP